jgi:hypothetical protein
MNLTKLTCPHCHSEIISQMKGWFHIGEGVESSIHCLVIFSIDYEIRAGVNPCSNFLNN